jgi:beta-phosphoglucomutase-like phosphatase (HAD superfamily)
VSGDGVCDLVVFDCDGVLVDSERVAIRVDAVVLERLGWPLSEAEIVDRFVGRPHAFMVTEIEAQLGCPLPLDWEAECAPLYDQAFRDELVAVDGIPEVLDLLARDHPALPTCVASSSKHTSIRRSLDLTGLRHHFAEDRIFSVQDVEHGKPAPDVFLHAAASMGVDPARCTVIEDSAHGVAAGRAAGMRVLAYAGGVTPPERLVGPGTELFADMRDLPALLGLHT